MFSCTLNGVPESHDLLEKCRLPLGLHLQPFRDLRGLKVLQTVITRCRYCRTYINPFVFLMDARHWKCNLCYRANELPEDFAWDPQTKTFGDPSRRPELQETTIEYIAPSEYMLRPPQPPIYLFVFDVGSAAIDCGYLNTFAEQLSLDIDKLPGQERAFIGFIGFDSALHFFQFDENEREPRHIIEFDVEESFAPVFSGLFVELNIFKEIIKKFIYKLPSIFERSMSSSNCLGSALTVAKNLINEVGGRITVFTASMPNIGIGALNCLEVNTAKKIAFTPQIDFYKSLALECTGKQIAMDLFVVGCQNVDLRTLSDMSRFSSGTVYHFPEYHFLRDQVEVKRFQMVLRRYFIRKLGLEAVLRIRCSRGLSLHTFYGNFFVRSTDLLALPNVSPDSAMGVQIKHDEVITASQVCFQAALLYTSTKGDRRIRVHTLCLPVFTQAAHVFSSLDINSSISLLSKMASDRAMQGASLSDCREALINAIVDPTVCYQRSLGQVGSMLRMPPEGGLQYMPIYILGLLKNRAFSDSLQRVTIDEHVATFLLFKNAPLEVLLLELCPALYAFQQILYCEPNQDGQVPFPDRLPPTYEHISQNGIYLLDIGTFVYVYVGSALNVCVLRSLFGTDSFAKLDSDSTVTEIETPQSKHLHAFLRHLQEQRGNVYAPAKIIKDDSPKREAFTRRLIQDRSDSSHSYNEFMQFLQREVSKARISLC
ncbi:hypothetical protein niasHT_001740 [Heterodera trifolii]|uniref:Uncharacterized protein n=1 Tax=Heterodera trifolii TaxID=157864 RepID=A0ABD2MB51_9BILA